MTARIDAHQHFWTYTPEEFGWIADDEAAIRRDFYPADLEPLLQQTGFDGCIAVQARSTVEETEWLLDLARDYDFIKGVVGWVDLLSERVDEQLRHFAADPKLVGVRHIVQGEPDDSFVLRKDFQNGIARLAAYDLAYDLLLYPRHLQSAAQLVRAFPEQRFVLDHIAKPDIRAKRISPWREDLLRLAELPNVWCKLSGMVTEADKAGWSEEDFHPYLDIVFDAFGPERLMIGSDWPVSLASRGYSSVMGIVMNYIRSLPQEAQDGILGGNCAAFYKLSGTVQSRSELPGK